jgi:hypothetical protein
VGKDTTYNNAHHGTRKTGTVVRVASCTAEKQRCRGTERNDQ